MCLDQALSVKSEDRRISPSSETVLTHQRRGPPCFGGRHTHDFASGHHNVVDVERIRRGLDVRTTVGLVSSSLRC
jgi:hypothetical protein